jgi:hypothetical protein
MTANITTDALLTELSAGSVFNVNEYNADAVAELVARGLAVIEVKHELFGRKRGGKEFSRTLTTVRFVPLRERICTPMSVQAAGRLLVA